MDNSSRSGDNAPVGERRHFQKLTPIRWMATGVACVCVVSVWARPLFADRWLLTELNFLLPLIAPLLFGSIAALIGKGPIIARLGILLAIVLGGIVSLIVEQPIVPRGGGASTDAKQTLTITAWNVMSYNRGEKEVTNAIKSDDPGIVLILEGTYRSQPPDFLRRGLGDDYSWTATKQMAIGAKAAILESEEVPCESGLRVFTALIQQENGAVRIVLVDVPRAPRLNTDEIFTELRAVLKTWNEPMIVAGDFNTPRGSWWLDRALDGFTDVYRSAATPGQWLGSWPSQAPLYQLDHCFVSKELTPISAELLPGASDHHRQRVTIGVPE